LSGAGADAHAVRVALWNVEWARAGSPRGEAVRARLAATAADVLMVAEGEAALLPADTGGDVLASEPDYGYPPVAGRRKVLLWSRTGWRDTDVRGDARLPPGRYAAGTTTAGGAPLRVVGVCVPWRDAHVRTGRRDRSPWEDHGLYLEALGPLLARERARHARLAVVGDLNQRIPRRGQPRAMAAALDAALAGLEVVTAGHRCEDRALVDHVAVTPALCVRAVTALPRHDGVRRLSDHDALLVDLAPA